MRKYPEPKKQRDFLFCPECGKKYKSLKGYHYHYKVNHGEPEQEVNLDGKDIRSIADMVIGDMGKRERLKPVVEKKTSLKPESWVLQDGDWHYGLKVNPVEVGGLSEYNIRIAKERREQLATSIVRMLDYHPNPPSELVIVFQGDMVDGSVLRGNQQSNIEFGVVKQVMDASELMTDFIVFLSRYFSRIRCYGVFGNHARLTKNPTDAHHADNFDVLTYYIVKERIKGMKGISLDYTEAQHMIVKINGYNFWCEHGDTVRSWMGIPFYGSIRERANIQEILNLYSEKADYVLMGHHHDRAIFKNVHINGSFVGGDIYSVGMLRRMSLPVQNLFGVSSKHGVVWERQLKLVENIKEQHIKIYE